MAIKGVHALFFTDQPDEARAFLRDTMGIPCFDSGGGWLIFKFGEADMGVHPINPGGGPPSGTHDISFYCDDLDAEIASLQGKGVDTGEVDEQPWGRLIRIEVPGGIKVGLYEPKYK